MNFICNDTKKNNIKFMNILRKILGVSLLIISLLLILATISSSIETISEAHKESGGERIGYILGCLIFGLLMVWLIFFMIKKGIQFLKNKAQNSIEEIGQS